MDREDGLVGIRHPLDQAADGVGELVGDVVADRVGDVDGLGAGFDGCLDDPAQKSSSERPASSAENSTSSVQRRARRTASTARSTT
jgi:hypothetical protein